MALVDLKSNLANFRSDFVTPGVEKKNAPEASALNIDIIPNIYSGKTQFTNSFIEKSLFDRASKFILRYSGNTKFTPKYVNVNSKFNKDSANIKFSPSGVYLPDNFTPAKINSSKFNIDSNPTKFSPSGIYLPELYTTAKINASKFNIDVKPVKFSPSTKYNPTKYYPEKSVPQTINRWSGNTPPAVNFIKDNTSNAKGFTINLGKTTSVLNSISGDKSQFISFVYTKQFSTYNTNFDQGTVSLTRQLGKGSPFPDFNGVTLNWAPKPHTGFFTKDKYEIAAKAVKDPSGDPNGFLRPSFERTGYTKVFTTKNSKFDQGIVSINRQLGKGSPFRDFIGPANWLPKPHTGFFDKNRYEDAAKAIILDGKSKQGFLAATFKPSGNLQSIDMDNSQFQMGRAKFLQQLGDGKLRLVKNYESGTVYDWFTPTSAFDKGVKNPHTGYHRDNLYVPKGIKFKGYLAPTYNTNSPIDELYKKYNLQDAANSETTTGPVGSYIRQPFIERGIQRKGKESPQRWGIGNFDDGLIRGGITTAIERAAVDTARIAKWMTSPRGLLWIVKQIGLGLTNAKVEAPAGRFGRATRIHTGITSLLSVAGTAFGLHFTRHGIPFRNSRADYEEVIRGKTSVFNDLFPEISNRLLTLRTELGLNSAYALDTNVGGTMLTLSGWGGPESVYGIGYTSIKRKVHSRLDRGGNKLTSFYNVRSQYASFESKSRFKSGTGIDNNINTFQNIDLQSAKNTDERSSLKTRWIDSTGGTTEVEITKKSDFPILDKFGIQFTGDIKVINAPENVYRPDSILKNRDIDTEGNALIVSKSFEPYFSKAKTGHAKDPYKYQTNSPGNIKEYDEASNLKKKANKLADPTSNVDPGTGGKIIDTASTRQYSNGEISTVRPIDNYLTLAYGKIPAKISSSFNDFRQAVETQNDIDRGLVGKRTDADYYDRKNLEKYGFGKLGEVGKDRSNPYEFIESNALIDTTQLKNNTDRFKLANNDKFRGDKITAINVLDSESKIDPDEVYDTVNASDLIKFYFEDGNEGYNVMPFRCTMTGFTDNFSPGWDKIDIMGRPDGAYLYTSFERSISFNFIVAALSRSEMIPMWRKLNRLASYTMPDFSVDKGRPAGPFMRISIGNLFQRTPGFITSLSYTIPEDASWDIGDDISANNVKPKQLPMMVEVGATFTIVGDYRPQLNGRVYNLEPLGKKAFQNGDWIPDAKTPN